MIVAIEAGSTDVPTDDESTTEEEAEF